MNDYSKYRYGFVLSGGGARGFAHLGVAKALEEKGIRPSVISGVSAGAIFGAYLASGTPIEETMEILKSHRFLDISRPQLPKTGLFNMDKLEGVLQSTLGNINLEELPVPLVIAATDIRKARIRYFTEGRLSRCVVASASIPVVFTPVNIEGEFYVDGGVFTNLPVAPIKDKVDYIIGCNVSPVEQVNKLGNIIDIAARTFQLSVNANTENISKLCDLYLEPEGLASFPLFDTSKADELFKIGYDYTKAQLEHTEPVPNTGFWERLKKWFNFTSLTIPER
ncbi:patatin-like phospholipase family protein [Robertkochia aurantiaca]|uniref:patatin-like phospholipase family protein n=1 Tax=Robertkochia aurantiaca TaxID=2873700 RepID=UPI001CD03449|nr:patatin-like phospholipase family protein [Robertkochia sp. 3YJGBD-33]